MHDIAERCDRSQWVRREVTVEDIELREEGGTLTFDGIASRVDAPYTVRDAFGEFTETVHAGSFNRTIKQKSDVRLLVNHLGVPLARTKSHTLTLSANPDLRSVAPSLDPANPTVQEIRSALARRDIDQMSIGMRVRDDKWNDDYTERDIYEVELRDVSIVTFPASPTTTAALRFDEVMRSVQTGDLTDDELRRAITHFSSLLPQEEREEVEEAPDLTARYIELWAKRQVA